MQFTSMEMCCAYRRIILLRLALIKVLYGIKSTLCIYIRLVWLETLYGWRLMIIYTHRYACLFKFTLRLLDQYTHISLNRLTVILWDNSSLMFLLIFC